LALKVLVNIETRTREPLAISTRRRASAWYLVTDVSEEYAASALWTKHISVVVFSMMILQVIGGYHHLHEKISFD
jgi:hypothetical protein